MSADVVSFAAAAAQLASAGEVTEIRGPTGADFGAAPPAEVKFAEGDDVTIIYRAIEGRPEIRSVLYGPTTKRVAWGLCRELAKRGADDVPTAQAIAQTADRIIARPAGNPRPFDLTWVEIAPGHPDAGLRLARVQGVSHIQLNIALGRPVARLEHSHTGGRAVPLFDPEGLAISGDATLAGARSGRKPAARAPLPEPDPDDEASWLEPGIDRSPYAYELSGEDE